MLRFFNNVIDNVIDSNPNKLYRNLQQEFINMQWDNTTALYTVQEQEDIGANCYHDLDVWLIPTVADTSTGMKDVRDFNKLIFHDIDHTVKRGLMYKFDNCYWIVHSYSEYDGVVQDCGIRRCNNVLKMIDPENGAIFSIPCVVDYDMAASTVKVTKYILTPNNHAVIMVQGNKDTLRLFKTNTRFMLSGRPFKLYGYQNAVEYDNDLPSTLLYLDLYLDEFREGDNLETGVAENGTYNYSISINSQDLVLLNEAIGKLSANVLLNDVEVERNVSWYSDDCEIVEIDNEGNYIVHGEIGDSANIIAVLDGNCDVFDSINITIGNTSQIVSIVLEPDFKVIKQYESIKFKIEVYYNGELLDDDSVVTSATIESKVLELTQNNEFILNSQNEGILDISKLTDNFYILNSIGVSKNLQSLIINASSNNPQFNKTISIDIKAVSMLG